MVNASTRYASDSLQLVQRDVLRLIAVGHPLSRIMSDLCSRVEMLSPETRCAIFQVVDGGQLKMLAAPSLPGLHDDAATTEAQGTFSTKEAASPQGSEVEDPVSSYLAQFHNHELPSCCKASWASPILAGGYVVGLFAFYFSTNREANSFERQAVSVCVDLCAIAIEQSQSRDEIKRLAYFDQLTGLGNRSMLKAR